MKLQSIPQKRQSIPDGLLSYIEYDRIIQPIRVSKGASPFPHSKRFLTLEIMKYIKEHMTDRAEMEELLSMKKRKGNLLQRMMALLLSAVMAAGTALGTAPLNVLAQENAGGGIIRHRRASASTR